ncbi:MAG: hypothetical protein V7643_1097 [Mycobacterium sp.]
MCIARFGGAVGEVAPPKEVKKTFKITSTTPGVSHNKNPSPTPPPVTDHSKRQQGAKIGEVVYPKRLPSHAVGGRIGGPPTNLVAKPYRLKTMVPIALSSPDSGVAAAVEVICAVAGAANATAAVWEAAVLRVAAVLVLREIVTTAATAGSSAVSVDSVDSVDSWGCDAACSSTSCLAAGFTTGLCAIATGLTFWSAAFSAVSDPAGSASLTVAAVGCSSGHWAGGAV